MAKRAKRASRPNPREDRAKNFQKSRHYESKNNIIELNPQLNRSRKKVEIIPRNVQQEELLEYLEDDSKHIVFSIGPAGTGKTFVTALSAIKALRERKVERIVLTRPNVAVDDKDIGYLPGGILDKMAPWIAPILDPLREYYTKSEIEQMMEDGTIEVVPIAYMRGRSFRNTIIMVDEAQGTTQNSLLSILTRIGEGSKIVVTGDLAQSDRGPSNGLADFVERFSKNNINGVAVVEFNRSNVQRHPVIKDILKLYGQE